MSCVPRRAPSAVLWLTAAVVIGGSSLLLQAPGATPPATLAASSTSRPSKPAAAMPATASGQAEHPTSILSNLHVP